MKRLCAAALFAFLLVLQAFGKSEPGIVVDWPSEKPVLRLTFGAFRQQGTLSDQSIYLSDVTVESLTDKPISRVLFTVSLFSKNKIRIGRGTLLVADLNAGQSSTMPFQFNSAGVPASVTLSAKENTLGPPGKKTLPLRIVSVPPAAKLTIDGRNNGITPMIVWLTVGSHQLELTKEGYAPKSTSLEVTPDELPGTSVTIQLGGSSRDTVELRDGTVLVGQVISMSMTTVIMRVDGKIQSYPRSQINKMMLSEQAKGPQPAVARPAVPSSPR